MARCLGWVHCAYSFVIYLSYCILDVLLCSCSPVVFLQSFNAAHRYSESLVPSFPGYRALKSPVSMLVFVRVLRWLDCSISVMPLIHSSGLSL